MTAVQRSSESGSVPFWTVIVLLVLGAVMVLFVLPRGPSDDRVLRRLSFGAMERARVAILAELLDNPNGNDREVARAVNHLAMVLVPEGSNFFRLQERGISVWMQINPDGRLWKERSSDHSEVALYLPVDVSASPHRMPAYPALCFDGTKLILTNLPSWRGVNFGSTGSLN